MKKKNFEKKDDKIVFFIEDLNKEMDLKKKWKIEKEKNLEERDSKESQWERGLKQREIIENEQYLHLYTFQYHLILFSQQTSWDVWLLLVNYSVWIASSNVSNYYYYTLDRHSLAHLVDDNQTLDVLH